MRKKRNTAMKHAEKLMAAATTEALERVGGSLVRIQKLTGLNDTSLSRHRKDGTISAADLYVLAQTAGVSLDELIHGGADPRPAGEAVPLDVVETALEHALDQFMAVLGKYAQGQDAKG